jgi:hypothetical protein
MDKIYNKKKLKSFNPYNEKDFKFTNDSAKYLMSIDEFIENINSQVELGATHLKVYGSNDEYNDYVYFSFYELSEETDEQKNTREAKYKLDKLVLEARWKAKKRNELAILLRMKQEGEI